MRKVEAEYCIVAIGFSSLRAKMVLMPDHVMRRVSKGLHRPKAGPILENTLP